MSREVLTLKDVPAVLLTEAEGDARYAPKTVVLAVQAQAQALPSYCTQEDADRLLAENRALAERASTLEALADTLREQMGALREQAEALLGRVASLEGQMGAGANGHYHLMGTWRETQKATLPSTVLEEVPAA
jgi:hypothetical protein